MEIWQILQDLLFDYTLRTVALGSAILGVVSGALGAFAVLRRQSLLGDAISHAALPGIVLAFLLTRSKLSIVMLLGAVAAGWLATIWMMSIIKNTRIKEDSALGLVLSVFFGFGMMLLTFTQRMPDSRQAGLTNFLFGQAAALLEQDILVMAVLGGTALFVLLLFWKEFKLLSFDRAFGMSLGFPMVLLDIALTTLLVIAIVIGLQAVGVVLMSAMIVAPAAAARQWTDRLGVMVLLSAFFGALAGVIGTIISSLGRGLSTGPTIVLTASTIVLVSLLFAPHRGIFFNWLREKRSSRKLHTQAVLNDLYILAAQHAGEQRPHDMQTLEVMSSGDSNIKKSLETLESQDLAARYESGWVLTEKGLSEAKRLTRQHSGGKG
jgi:manganese/zinc/iron transport system permease protein